MFAACGIVGLPFSWKTYAMLIWNDWKLSITLSGRYVYVVTLVINSCICDNTKWHIQLFNSKLTTANSIY